MKRWVAVLAGCALVLASIGEGLLVWRFARHQGPQYPEISAYSRSETVRVGPYLYCTPRVEGKTILIADDDCVEPGNSGTLVVDADNAVQLSVPEELARGPWRVNLSYEISDVEGPHPDDQSRALTIPTVDPLRGRLQYFVVGLPDPAGRYYAEWTVNAVWPDEKATSAN
jgi:hypothetical protein